MTTRVETDALVNDRASAKLDRIADALVNVGRAGQKAGGQAASGMSKLTQGAGFAIKGLTKLPALAAGTVVGTLFVSGLVQAMDVQDANAKLQAGLGLNEAQSAKAGKIAGDLYKNAYGDSIGDIGQTLTTVFQSGLASVNDSEDAIKGVTTAVENFSKISGEEALPVTRAVSQMLKTGLAKNAKEAFDILTRGQQLGINKSEDLLDTFNEYGTQFRKLGLDGPAALGLMNQALQAGARDSDIAADAIKEFSIRAVDGSTLTATSFRALGLNAKTMAETFAQGGPKAATALGLVLDKLRGVEDPAKRAQIAVGLFGTQAEDLGAALYAMDTGTAVKSLGNLEGAADRAGDALNDTASNKLTTVARTIKMGLVDAIGKYALPQLEKFADWFNGPGKLVITGWALDAGSAVLGMADAMLGGIQTVLGGLGKFGRVASLAAAGAVALFNPSMAAQLLKNADSMGQWADEAADGIGKARTSLHSWQDTLDKTSTKVKLEATIVDLETKLEKAQKELQNPNLTKERRAHLRATIADLEAKIRAAKGGSLLGSPALTATKIAKLEATKTGLDAKIGQAKAALRSPDLTRERRAKLNADIGALLAKKRQAQTAIDNLRGKTVYINFQATGSGASIALNAPGSYGRRAAGGPVRRGTPYIVGEKQPELFIPNQDGEVLPFVPPSPSGGASGYGASGAAPVVVFQSDGSRMGDLIVEILREGVRIRGGSVDKVLSRKAS